MRILINLSTLKTGGGQNVGLNFLSALKQMDYNANCYYYLVARNSAIHKYLIQNKFPNIITSSHSPIKRIFLEILKISKSIRKSKIDIIYTYFGYGMFNKKIPQVCGVAVSNIFFPEIKFWQGNKFQLLVYFLMDKYWIYGIKNANGLIFENKQMEVRSHSLFNIKPNKTIYIPPSFSQNFENKSYTLPSDNRQINCKLLMLSGWHLNKNIMSVPEIAYSLKKSNINFHFIITAPLNNSSEHLTFLKLLKKYSVEDLVSLIGQVKKEQLKSLYEKIDFVVLMSKLESFSNNVIEAWQFRKPLVISNANWAKEICKDAAYYIERDNPSKIANALIHLYKNESIQKNIVNNGLLKLKEYPTIEEKTMMEMKFIEKIYHESKDNN